MARSRRPTSEACARPACLSGFVFLQNRRETSQNLQLLPRDSPMVPTLSSLQSCERTSTRLTTESPLAVAAASSSQPASWTRSSASQSFRQPAVPAATVTTARAQAPPWIKDRPQRALHGPPGTERRRHTGSTPGPGHGDPRLDNTWTTSPLTLHLTTSSLPRTIPPRLQRTLNAHTTPVVRAPTVL